MFKRLKEGIARTRDGLLNRLGRLFGRREPIDGASLETLEAALLMADIGVQTTATIISAVKKRAQVDGPALIEIVHDEMVEVLAKVARPLTIPSLREGPYVVLIVGVNGVGKTTTIAKIGRYLQAQGLSVMFAAGDTFRAAAVDQLKAWGERLKVSVVAKHRALIRLR